MVPVGSAAPAPRRASRTAAPSSRRRVPGRDECRQALPLVLARVVAARTLAVFPAPGHHEGGVADVRGSFHGSLLPLAVPARGRR